MAVTPIAGRRVRFLIYQVVPEFFQSGFDQLAGHPPPGGAGDAGLDPEFGTKPVVADEVLDGGGLGDKKGENQPGGGEVRECFIRLSGFPACRSTMPRACRLTATSRTLAGSGFCFHSVRHTATNDSGSTSAVSSGERSRANPGFQARAAAAARRREQGNGKRMRNRDGKTPAGAASRFFHKFWKSLISTAIGAGMTRIATHTDTTPLHAPGGARMGSATLARLSRTGEIKARATGTGLQAWSKIRQGGLTPRFSRRGRLPAALWCEAP